MNKELARTLTAALSQFIDANRKEGVMCMSSYECELMERTFMRGDFDQIEIYLKKKLNPTLEEKSEKPDKSLEEEIETWIPAHISVGTDETLPVNPIELANVCKEWGKGIASHFAEWGAEHLK